MSPFSFQLSTTRVRVGVDALKALDEELSLAQVHSALVLSTPGQEPMARRFADSLGGRSVGIFAGALMHVPVSSVEEGLAATDRTGADVWIAVGGGSTIGLAKAMAVHRPCTFLAVPTTYAGSEMTDMYGTTVGALKTVRRDARVRPHAVIYDPRLIASLPVQTSGSSAMNSMAHAIEAMYAEHTNPFVQMLAEESLHAFKRGIFSVQRDPGDLEARSATQYAASMAGAAFDQAGVCLHHKLCHTLGGTFNLPHAEMHSVLLPYTVAYNEPSVPEAMARIKRALGFSNVGVELQAFANALGVPGSLREIGMPRDGLLQAAALAADSMYYNPAPVSREEILKLLERAWGGMPPLAGPLSNPKS